MTSAINFGDSGTSDPGSTVGSGRILVGVALGVGRGSTLSPSLLHARLAAFEPREHHAICNANTRKGLCLRAWMADPNKKIVKSFFRYHMSFVIPNRGIYNLPILLPIFQDNSMPFAQSERSSSASLTRFD
jgi:hypothetical protein